MSNIVHSSYFFKSLLGTFVFLTIPLILLPVFDFSYYLLATFYTTVIVFPHFSSTFYVYFRKDYISYFLSSPKNILIYFIIPLIVLFTFISINKVEKYNYLSFWIVVIIRLTDYFHTNKQTFGVQRLIAGRSFKYDRLLYYGVILFLILNYLVKRDFIYLYNFEWALFLFVIISLILFIREILSSSISTKKKSLSYIILQLLALAPGVINPSYYFLGLAVHSVEYHLLNYKRFFYKDILRFTLFGVTLFILSIAVNRVKNFNEWKDTFFDLNFLYSSIVFLHYYLDTFIWRFSNPFFVKDLKKL